MLHSIVGYRSGLTGNSDVIAEDDAPHGSCDAREHNEGGDPSFVHRHRLVVFVHTAGHG